MSVLVVDGLVGGYAPGDQIVKGVSLTAAAREIVAIIGPNGAGKSTALKLAAGLLLTGAGRVSVAGRDVTGASPQQVLAAGFVLVPQERNIFGALTIEDNLAIGAHTTPRLIKRRRERVYETLPLLKERRRALGRTLSGGQRQMLAMGLALMAEPKVLALDEPTAGLSPVAAEGLFRTVRGLADSGVAIVMVEQNAIEALAIADRAYVLVDGRVAHEGAAAAIAADDGIRRMFLGGRKHAA
jgi:branched-chain amino acid transport system ATP-binding protein/neutral amino acid transport system ATP-binding protein